MLVIQRKVNVRDTAKMVAGALYRRLAGSERIGGAAVANHVVPEGGALNEKSEKSGPSERFPVVDVQCQAELKRLASADDYAAFFASDDSLGIDKQGASWAFLKALGHLHRGDLYWAADSIYQWLKRGGTIDTRISVQGQGAEQNQQKRHVLPLVGRLIPARKSDTSKDGVDLLESLRELYRDKLFQEAVALGLARFRARNGDYDGARATLLKVKSPNSHFRIDNALYTIGLKASGQHVPPYLERYIGDDNDHLLKRTCLEPFTRFDIDYEGGVMVCCGYWLRDTKIGNLYKAKGSAIINSDVAKDIRRSVVDGSFKYCDELRCPHITGESLPLKTSVSLPEARAGVDEGKFEISSPQYVLFAFDQTCNLSCPSCRTAIISDKQADRDRKAAIIEESVVPLMHDARHLNLNVAGEVWASKASRALLARVNRHDFPKLKITIISNGTLFTPAEWNKFPNIHGMVEAIRISIDASTRETFEKLRRGGQWESFLNNMEFVSSLRKSNVVPFFVISFTYQVENYREMPDFVRLGKSWGCDQINFEKLENLGTYSAVEYAWRAIHKPEHPDHGKFLEILSDPLLSDPIVFPDYKHLMH